MSEKIEFYVFSSKETITNLQDQITKLEEETLGANGLIRAQNRLRIAKLQGKIELLLESHCMFYDDINTQELSKKELQDIADATYQQQKLGIVEEMYMQAVYKYTLKKINLILNA